MAPKLNKALVALNDTDNPSDAVAPTAAGSTGSDTDRQDPIAVLTAEALPSPDDIAGICASLDTFTACWAQMEAEVWIANAKDWGVEFNEPAYLAAVSGKIDDVIRDALFVGFGMDLADLTKYPLSQGYARHKVTQLHKMMRAQGFYSDIAATADKGFVVVPNSLDGSQPAITKETATAQMTVEEKLDALQKQLEELQAAITAARKAS